MAQNDGDNGMDGVKYGELATESNSFETVAKDYSWSDQQTMDMTVVGDFDKLWAKNVKPGMAASGTGLVTIPNSQWCVRTVSLSREEMNVGTMKLNLVYCSKGLTQPYAQTIEMTMEEVQMALLTHPKIKDAGETELEEIRGWERYRAISANAVKDGSYYWEKDGVETQVKGEMAIKYCKAVSAGIETYNKYLPVVRRVSQYLRLPGVSYDASSNSVTGGSVDGADGIGEFDNPPIGVKGASGGKWFKSGDSYTMAADGSWTRTEQWTFTDDAEHSWIYEKGS